MCGYLPTFLMNVSIVIKGNDRKALGNLVEINAISPNFTRHPGMFFSLPRTSMVPTKYL